MLYKPGPHCNKPCLAEDLGKVQAVTGATMGSFIAAEQRFGLVKTCAKVCVALPRAV